MRIEKIGQTVRDGTIQRMLLSDWKRFFELIWADRRKGGRNIGKRALSARARCLRAKRPGPPSASSRRSVRQRKELLEANCSLRGAVRYEALAGSNRELRVPDKTGCGLLDLQ